MASLEKGTSITKKRAEKCHLLVFCTLFLLLFHQVNSEVWGQKITRNTTHGINEYLLFSTSMSWMEAAKTCHDKNYKLMCYNDREEMLYLLQSSLAAWGKIEVWIGKRGCDKWLNEKCLSLKIEKFSDSNKELFDMDTDCEQNLPFICKKEIPVSTPTPNVTTPSSTILFSCPSIHRRDIHWPETIGNTKRHEECPGTTEGLMKGAAEWYCDGKTGKWTPDNPDLGQCKSIAMTKVLERMEFDHIVEVTREMRTKIREIKYGGEIETVVEILDKIDDVFQTMPTEQQKQDITHVADDFVEVCNDLIKIQDDMLHDLTETSRISTANRFLHTVEEQGLLLAKNIEENEQQLERDSFVLKVYKQAKDHSKLTFSPDVHHNKSKGSITIPITSYQDDNRVVFAWYSDLSNFLTSDQLIGMESTPEDKLRRINTAVISANISGSRFGDRLSSDAVIILEHFESGASNPICAYWDTEIKKWSSNGCTLRNTNSTHTTCACNHLTNFAVIMDVRCTTCTLASTHQVILSVITLIGCIISLFCLSLCIVIFTCYRSLWGIRTTIHRSLCISLWFAEGLLIIGLDRTGNRIICSLVAGLLHYFFLAAFFWMFLEGFHIMILLVNVFTPKNLHVAQHYLVGFLTPAVIVGITAAVRPYSYGTRDYCWLSTEDGTIWSFLGPVAVIIFFNTVTLAKALWTMHQLTKSKEKMPADGLKMWVRGSAVLLPLLGVTWATGFLYIDTRSLFMAYIFTILNSLQGVGIFVFQILLNKNVFKLITQSMERSLSRSDTIRQSGKSTTSSFRSMISFRRRGSKKLAKAKPVDETEAKETYKSTEDDEEGATKQLEDNGLEESISFITPNDEGEITEELDEKEQNKA